MTNQHKLEKCENLREQCVQNGCIADIFPIEIGCKGFVAATDLFPFANQCPRFESWSLTDQ